MTVLHHADVADGSLLELACGLECVGQRFDQLVERYVPGDLAESGTDDERTVDLLLGLIAVRASVRRVLGRARTTPPLSAEAADAFDVEHGSWLR